MKAAPPLVGDDSPQWSSAGASPSHRLLCEGEPYKFDQLIEAVVELASIQRQQVEQVRALAEAQSRMEEQLEALSEAKRRT